MAGQVRVDPPTPGSDTNIFYPLTLSGPISPFELQKKAVTPVPAGSGTPCLCDSCDQRSKLHCRALMRIGKLGQNTDFFFFTELLQITAAKPKHKFSSS